MIEKLKNVLILEQEEKLKRQNWIEERYESVKNEQQKIKKINEELEQVEKETLALRSKFFSRKWQKKKIRKLYMHHGKLMEDKCAALEKYNLEKDLIIKEFYGLIEDKNKIKERIEHLKNVKKLQELNLSEKEAIERLEQKEENAVIKVIFAEVKESEKLKDSIDIFKTMQNLFQTNTSAFVNAMKNIDFTALVQALKDIGITLEKEKCAFLEKLMMNKNNIAHLEDALPLLETLNQENELDIYYKEEVEKVIQSIQKYPNICVSAISQIMTLTILIAIAKES